MGGFYTKRCIFEFALVNVYIEDRPLFLGFYVSFYPEVHNIWEYGPYLEEKNEDTGLVRKTRYAVFVQANLSSHRGWDFLLGWVSGRAARRKREGGGEGRRSVIT